MNNTSIQKGKELGEIPEDYQPSTDDNKALGTGGGDPLDREQNNNGLGELDPSKTAAEPTAGSAKTASASIPAASVTSLKKAPGMLVSISLGTPCEKATHEDECCDDPPIVSDTYHAPETPVKTKGGKSKVTHPSEHPKPMNKGEDHIPTWDELRKSIANKETKDYLTGGATSDTTALNSQDHETDKIEEEYDDLWSAGEERGKKDDARGRFVRYSAGTPSKDNSHPVKFTIGMDPVEAAVRQNVREREAQRAGGRDRILNGAARFGQNGYRKSEEDHIPTWNEIKKAYDRETTGE